MSHINLQIIIYMVIGACICKVGIVVSIVSIIAHDNCFLLGPISATPDVVVHYPSAIMIDVGEGEDFRLQCETTGWPKPTIQVG